MGRNEALHVTVNLKTVLGRGLWSKRAVNGSQRGSDNIGRFLETVPPPMATRSRVQARKWEAGVEESVLGDNVYKKMHCPSLASSTVSAQFSLNICGMSETQHFQASATGVSDAARFSFPVTRQRSLLLRNQRECSRSGSPGRCRSLHPGRQRSPGRVRAALPPHLVGLVPEKRSRLRARCGAFKLKAGPPASEARGLGDSAAWVPQPSSGPAPREQVRALAGGVSTFASGKQIGSPGQRRETSPPAASAPGFPAPLRAGGGKPRPQRLQGAWPPQAPPTSRALPPGQPAQHNKMAVAPPGA